MKVAGKCVVLINGREFTRTELEGFSVLEENTPPVKIGGNIYRPSKICVGGYEQLQRQATIHCELQETEEQRANNQRFVRELAGVEPEPDRDAIAREAIAGLARSAGFTVRERFICKGCGCLDDEEHKAGCWVGERERKAQP